MTDESLELRHTGGLKKPPLVFIKAEYRQIANKRNKPSADGARIQGR
jgi:hypothetical protein